MSTPDITVTDGRPEAWVVLDGIGGYICAEPDADKPDGICGMPVESEPCEIHHPAIDLVDEQRCPNCAPGYDCESGIYVSVDQAKGASRG